MKEQRKLTTEEYKLLLEKTFFCSRIKGYSLPNGDYELHFTWVVTAEHSKKGYV